MYYDDYLKEEAAKREQKIKDTEETLYENEANIKSLINSKSNEIKEKLFTACLDYVFPKDYDDFTNAEIEGLINNIVIDIVADYIADKTGEDAYFVKYDLEDYDDCCLGNLFTQYLPNDLCGVSYCVNEVLMDMQSEITQKIKNEIYGCSET